MAVMWRARAIAILNLALFLTLLGMARSDSFDSLRLTWQSTLISNGTNNSTLSSIASKASGYQSSLNATPSSTNFYLWSDLPLGSVSANITSTYNRLQAMALAWATPGCSLYGDSSLAAAISKGLDWMAAKVFTTNATYYDNWHDWEIAVPQSLNNTEVLFYSGLTGAQITNYCTAVDYMGPDGVFLSTGFNWSGLTGANTSDVVLAMAVRGILGKNAAKLTEAQTNLSKVFPCVTSGDGFYHDGSFVFHGNIAYTGHYGYVLLGDVATLVNLLQGSPWVITNTNLAKVYGWITNSFEPLIYNGAMMDMVRGRAMSWPTSTETTDGATVLSDIGKVANFAPPVVANALTNFIHAPIPPPGQFHFANMDRVVALRSGFGFGLSLSSARIANYENLFSSSNLKGWFTGDGMTYLYLGTNETQFTGDCWPTIDWYHLPGTTAETNATPSSSVTDQNWVGGAQVGNKYGVAGMAQHAYGTTLYSKKSWFMFDNEVVCLGAGITCNDANRIETTVENRRLGASPTNNFWINGVSIAPVTGWSSNLTSVSWCALDGVAGYYFPGGATNLLATFATVSGTWSSIDVGASTTTCTDNYLKLYFKHGTQPTNATYAYVLLPNLSVGSVSNYALSPDIVVLTNTPTLQAVKKPALRVVAANFWSIGIASADFITANNSASVITLENHNTLSLGISDPTQTNTGVIKLTLNRSALSLLSADPGVTVTQLSPTIVLSVNVNGAQGKSFQASFTLPDFTAMPRAVAPTSSSHSPPAPDSATKCSIRTF